MDCHVALLLAVTVLSLRRNSECRAFARVRFYMQTALLRVTALASAGLLRVLNLPFVQVSLRRNARFSFGTPFGLHVTCGDMSLR